MRYRSAIAAAACAALAIGTAATATGATRSGRAQGGGTLQAAIADNPDHLDPGLSYATEGWETLEATGNGLLTFRKAAGPAGSQIVPDLALAMPTVSDGGRTYRFRMRTGVRFSPPVNREVEPSDIKFAIERLFRIDSGGVGFYSGIVGASRYAKTRTDGIRGIVANDRTHTITFHLTEPDGTFLDYMAIPFAFAVPKGTPDRDISTVDAWRVATGPYMITSYVPKQEIVLKRNPNFRQWTPNSPNGHLDEIDVKIGVDPESAVNMTAAGQLDWYFGAVPGDRLRELQARSPKQVHVFDRNNITYFELNHRKPPFDKLAVRQALNYAVDRSALVKIFGGQGTPTENIIPPGFGAAYRPHHFYPYDLAKAKALVQQSGDAGMAVTVWSHSTDPAPKAAQYIAGVLDTLGFHATIKTEDISVYWDTISTQKGDPQIAFVQFDQDYPEGQDFIDVQLNGERIANVGNQVHSNVDVPALNRRIDAARRLPLGTRRAHAWAALDSAFMRQDAPWVPFMYRQLPKFVSSRLHGLVFSGTYYELFPAMELK
jgi:peptide/nickel transport system substrate-binding protein